MILQTTKHDYSTCGECMFLSVSLFEVAKHGVEDVYCNLFNEHLEVTLPTVYSCERCNDAHLKGED